MAKSNENPQLDMAKHRITPEQALEITILLQRGFTKTEIAAKIGKHRNNISYYIDFVTDFHRKYKY